MNKLRNRAYPHVDGNSMKTFLSNGFPSLGKYLARVDTVMAQVDRITEDIAHMPVAAFIFRDKGSDEVHYSSDIRCAPYKSNE